MEKVFELHRHGQSYIRSLMFNERCYAGESRRPPPVKRDSSGCLGRGGRTGRSISTSGKLLLKNSTPEAREKSRERTKQKRAHGKGERRRGKRGARSSNTVLAHPGGKGTVRGNSTNGTSQGGEKGNTDDGRHRSGRPVGWGGVEEKGGSRLS